MKASTKWRIFYYVIVSALTFKISSFAIVGYYAYKYIPTFIVPVPGWSILLSYVQLMLMTIFFTYSIFTIRETWKQAEIKEAVKGYVG